MNKMRFTALLRTYEFLCIHCGMLNIYQNIESQLFGHTTNAQTISSAYINPPGSKRKNFFTVHSIPNIQTKLCDNQIVVWRGSEESDLKKLSAGHVVVRLYAPIGLATNQRWVHFLCSVYVCT